MTKVVRLALAIAERSPGGIFSAGQVAWLDAPKRDKKDAYYRAPFIADILLDSGKFVRAVNTGGVGKRVVLLRTKESCK